MGIIGDIAGLWDRVPVVKRLAGVTRDLEALQKRVLVLEAEVAKRPAPEICPMCRRDLLTDAVKPLISEMSGQFGEERHEICPAAPAPCSYPGRWRRVDH